MAKVFGYRLLGVYKLKKLTIWIVYGFNFTSRKVKCMINGTFLNIFMSILDYKESLVGRLGSIITITLIFSRYSLLSNVECIKLFNVGRYTYINLKKKTIYGRQFLCITRITVMFTWFIHVCKKRHSSSLRLVLNSINNQCNVHFFQNV